MRSEYEFFVASKAVLVKKSPLSNINIWDIWDIWEFDSCTRCGHYADLQTACMKKSTRNILHILRILYIYGFDRCIR